jgi:5-formyltetrahydrofolate cyclo-ligase
MAKSALRSQMRGRLGRLPDPPPPVHPLVTAWLAGRPQLRRVAVFAALPGEPDLLPLVAADRSREWCFPRVVGREYLAFHQVADPLRELREAAYGIREPLATTAQVAVADIDVFFCPGLAFDDKGGRLGHGRGYYDRALAAARPDAFFVGVCFRCQRVADTHSLAHDVRMHEVITEEA